MFQSIEEFRISQCLGDITNGYTQAEYKGTPVFIKHISFLDNLDVDKVYQDTLAKQLRAGVFSEEERLEDLKKHGLWTDNDDTELQRDTSYLENLKKSLKNLALKSQIDSVNVEIKELSQKVNKREQERFQLLMPNAECIARKTCNEYYIFRSFYKDESLKEPLFERSEFFKISGKVIDELGFIYLQAMDVLNGANIKKAAIFPMLLNLLDLSSSPMEFYGKPLCKLTFLQSELLSLAKFYKHILSEMKTQPPKHLMEDPEKLEQWYSSSQKADKLLEKSGGKSRKNRTAVGEVSSLVGATQDDLDYLGLNNNKGGVSLSSQLKDNVGEDGTISMEALMKIHGVT